MKNLVSLLLFASVLLFFSCETFPEGGPVKRADKNLEGTWKLSTYLRDNESANDVQISNYTEIYKSGGVFERSYTKEDQTQINETGEWSLAGDNLSINISQVSSIEDFSATNSTLSTSRYDLIKLKKDELWFEYENGGNLHQFRMTKQ